MELEQEGRFQWLQVRTLSLMKGFSRLAFMGVSQKEVQQVHDVLYH